VADVYDLAGNFAVRTQAFSVCGMPSAMANPETVKPKETSQVSVSGSLGPYTAEITSDTSGGASISGSSPGPWTVTAGPGSPSEETQIVVTVTDSCSGQTSVVTITVNKQCILTVSASKSAANGEKISVRATGGTPPYVFELTTFTPASAPYLAKGSSMTIETPTSLGKIDPLSGDYLAPSAGSPGSATIATIQAEDVNGCTGATTVKISPMALAVTTEVVADKVYFSVSTGTAGSSQIAPRSEALFTDDSIRIGDAISTTGMEGVTAEVLNDCGSVDGSGVYTAPPEKNCIADVKLTKGEEWAKVFILVKEGIPEVIEGIKVEDVNMDTVVDGSDLTPIIDWIHR